MVIAPTTPLWTNSECAQAVAYATDCAQTESVHKERGIRWWADGVQQPCRLPLVLRWHIDGIKGSTP